MYNCAKSGSSSKTVWIETNGMWKYDCRCSTEREEMFSVDTCATLIDTCLTFRFSRLVHTLSAIYSYFVFSSLLLFHPLFFVFFLFLFVPFVSFRFFLLVLSVSISFVSLGVCFFLFLFVFLFFFRFVFFEFGVSLEKNKRFECAAHQLYDFGLCGPRGLRGPWDPHISQTFYTHLLPTYPFNHQLSVGDYAVQLCVPNFAFPLSQPPRLSTRLISRSVSRLVVWSCVRYVLLTPCLCPLLDWCSIFPV